MSLSRRELGFAAAAAALAPRTARAFGDSARFIPAVAQHGGKWDLRLSGLRRLAWELARRTSVDVVPDARAVPLNSSKLFEYPFVYFGGEGEVPALSNEEGTTLALSRQFSPS